MNDEMPAGGIWGGGAGRVPQAPQAFQGVPKGPARVTIGEPPPRRRPRPHMWWWPNVDVVLASVCVAACIAAALLTHQSAYGLAALMAANWWLRTSWRNP